MTNIFYVYALIDPRSNLPFYVGKGSGNRAGFHLKEINHTRQSNPLKTNVIRQIQRMHLEVVVEMVEEYLDEITAWSLEATLIAKHGRRNNKTGILTNMTDGGEGSGGRTYNPVQAERISNALKGRKRPDVTARNIKKNKEMWEQRRACNWSHSEETRKTLSKQSSGRLHSDATKQKIALANSQREVKQSSKDKISAARKATKGQRKHSEETKANMRLAWVKRKEGRSPLL